MTVIRPVTFYYTYGQNKINDYLDYCIEFGQNPTQNGFIDFLVERFEDSGRVMKFYAIKLTD